jgi:hypothetical protein
VQRGRRHPPRGLGDRLASADERDPHAFASRSDESAEALDESRGRSGPQTCERSGPDRTDHALSSEASGDRLRVEWAQERRRGQPDHRRSGKKKTVAARFVHNDRLVGIVDGCLERLVLRREPSGCHRYPESIRAT